MLEVRSELRCAWRGQSLLITTPRGECGAQLPISGFYFRETRFLRTLRLTVNGEQPWHCETASVEHDALRFMYNYPEYAEFGGGGSGQSGDERSLNELGIPHRSIVLRADLHVEIALLRVILRVTNSSSQSARLVVACELDADFADILEGQNGKREVELPVVREPRDDSIAFECTHDRLRHRTLVRASGAGSWTARESALAGVLVLERGETATIELIVEPSYSGWEITGEELRRRSRHLDDWRARLANISIPSNTIMQEIVRANVSDYASFPLMDGVEDEWLAMQAGVPLYPALFGRDAITASWQAAFLDRGEVLDSTLTRLAGMQGTRVDDWRDEQPGRILQQLRYGPLAQLGINPLAAYYGDFASPLMFLIGLAHLYSWTGDRKILRRHWDAARRILDWAREYGDPDGDGYLEYESRSSKGTKNQGWKDGGDAIMYEDGSPVPVPIATCEVQGYWFAAQQLMAIMCLAMDEKEDARALRVAAISLKERFNREWWMPDESCCALALDPDKRQVRAVTSNASHCISSGIVDREHLPALVGRLFAPDMFSGWGIRTLSSSHASYNPISYHLGSVWAVEQATMVFGLRRFGFDARALELAESIMDLARLYPDYRIPECVGGYSRSERPVPGAYPRANTPQLWNASSIPLLLHSLLGLQPVAPLDLLVVDPVLPSWMSEVVLRDLRVGGATATIRFWRDAGGESHAEILNKRGTLHLLRQQPPESLNTTLRDRLSALVDGVLHK